MNRRFRLQVANTFLLIVVGLLVIVDASAAGAMAPALRFTIYGVGALVVIFAFGTILGARRDEGETDDGQGGAE